ncbi:MAG: superoxide dismutase [Saprospiraceae bacterium]|nr:superoxide dismutase [Saprospiraceae bacterium]
MKILAIEKEIEGVTWDNIEGLLEQEAKYVFQLYLSDNLREIYFTENKNAVLILETVDGKTAKELLDSLPLVKNKKIRFDMMELKPYTGYERIIIK